TKKPSDTGRPPSVAIPARNASGTPTCFCAARSRSAYFFESRKCSGSSGWMSVSSSRHEPSSTTSLMRSSVGKMKCAPHCGQHHRFLRTFWLSTVAPHPSHFWNRPDGTERFFGSVFFFSSLLRDHQAMSAPQPILHVEEREELIELADRRDLEAILRQRHQLG